jgi:hypothetical protein
MAGNMKQNLGDVIDLLKSIPDDVFEGSMTRGFRRSVKDWSRCSQ